MLYRVGIQHRNRAFDAGKGVIRLDRPVISIGNLSTGGTGKTPMVHLVLRLLLDAGRQPVIAMRGYGAAPGEKGDEQQEHESAFPNVPVVAQPDRIAGLRELLKTDTGGRLDSVVLDDGFQHRQIARDLDIVLIDATRPPTRDGLLPRGHLRDPIESLNRAGLVVLTHCERVTDESLNQLRSGITPYLADSVSVLHAQHTWAHITQFVKLEDGWDQGKIGLEHFTDQDVLLVCGIGNADAFVSMAEDSGFRIAREYRLGDHEPLSNGQIDELNGSAEVHGRSILMTQKDWVKVRGHPVWEPGTRVLVPSLSMDLGNDLAQLTENVLAVFSP